MKKYYFIAIINIFIFGGIGSIAAVGIPQINIVQLPPILTFILFPIMGISNSIVVGYFNKYLYSLTLSKNERSNCIMHLLFFTFIPAMVLSALLGLLHSQLLSCIIVGLYVYRGQGIIPMLISYVISDRILNLRKKDNA